jgi:DNA-binding NarL/FixJ family response regulator
VPVPPASGVASTSTEKAASPRAEVSASFAVSVERFSEVEIALQRLGEQRFDGLIVDFAEPETARQLLQAAYLSKPGAMITMALVNDEAAIRETLQNGAKFILHKPVSAEQAAATLRAVTAMLRPANPFLAATCRTIWTAF